MVEQIWHTNKSNWLKSVLFLSLACLVLSLTSLAIGSVSIPLNEVLRSLFGSSTNEVWNTIIIDFRLPRTITAILVGSSLGLSGLLMQTLFRNPLAGPFVLGISSGASLGVALLMMGVTWLPLVHTGITTVIAACIGAMAVLVIVLSMAGRLKDTTALLIMGLMFGSAVGAVVSILQYFSNPEALQGYLFWTFGSLSGVTWNELALYIPMVIAGFICVLLISKPLNVLQLGDNYAQSMGVSLKQFRYMVILITSLLAGVTTAFCGPIAFVGIAVPHIARLISASSNHYQLSITTSILGAGIMLICDLISQMPGFSQSLPINAITSIFGAPLIIWLIIRKERPITI